MNSIQSNYLDYTSFTQKIVKRHIATEVIEAKQTGSPIDVEKIRESNQAIKEKSVDVALTVYQANVKKNNIDTYIQSTNTTNSSVNSSAESANDIYTFDAKEVNEVRSTAQKRAIGIAIYEQVQAIKT